jgi:hypothetical protein
VYAYPLYYNPTPTLTLTLTHPLVVPGKCAMIGSSTNDSAVIGYPYVNRELMQERQVRLIRHVFIMYICLIIRLCIYV